MILKIILSFRVRSFQETLLLVCCVVLPVLFQTFHVAQKRLSGQYSKCNVYRQLSQAET